MKFFIPSRLNDDEKRILENCQRLQWQLHNNAIYNNGDDQVEIEQLEELPDTVADADVIIYWHQTVDALEKYLRD